MKGLEWTPAPADLRKESLVLAPGEWAMPRPVLRLCDGLRPTRYAVSWLPDVHCAVPYLPEHPLDIGEGGFRADLRWEESLRGCGAPMPGAQGLANAVRTCEYMYLSGLPWERRRRLDDWLADGERPVVVPAWLMAVEQEAQGGLSP